MVTLGIPSGQPVTLTPRRRQVKGELIEGFKKSHNYTCMLYHMPFIHFSSSQGARIAGTAPTMDREVSGIDLFHRGSFVNIVIFPIEYTYILQLY